LRTEKESCVEEQDDMDNSHAWIYEDQESPSPYEISLFIDELEDAICCGFSVPLSSKVVIDQEQCLEALEILRANLPWEMLEAKRILSEQEAVLEQAEAEAEETKQLAERQAAFILDQSHLLKMAETRAQELVEAAEQEAAKMLRLAEQDARHLYEGLERELDLLVCDIKELLSSRLRVLRD
jgi:vacuolar-type H+-ATPase subunit H